MQKRITIALPGKEGHSGLVPLKLCKPTREVLVRSFIAVGQGQDRVADKGQVWCRAWTPSSSLRWSLDELLWFSRISHYTMSLEWNVSSTINIFCLLGVLVLQSVQFSHWVVSNSLWIPELQHTRLPCPSPTPGTCSNSCPSGWWCHTTISSSVIRFSSWLKSFPASGSFPMSQLFPSGGQSIGASASASVLQMNIQDWFPLGLTSLISLQSKGCSRDFSNTRVQKREFFGA